MDILYIDGFIFSNSNASAKVATPKSEAPPSPSCPGMVAWWLLCWTTIWSLWAGTWLGNFGLFSRHFGNFSGSSRLKIDILIS